jgi:predicted O-linked N-acetylglucosamine transferase (SPINDLY family)
LKQIGRIFEARGNSATAERILRQSLDIDPTQEDVAQHLISLRQRQCKWPVIETLPRLSAQRLTAEIPPLIAAYHTDDPLFQLAVAHRFNRQSVGLPARSDMVAAPAARAGACARLRIGYVSSDLRGHAVGFGMAEVMELHDRRDFEIFAYYCGVRISDSTQSRIRQAVDHWTDLNDLDDPQAARRIAADEIDILVDLNGYTKDARTRVFALRPAPVNVNWFGFPGSMGSPYHHYIIADGHTIPASHELYYSEKVVRLPCYQPNDRRRIVTPSRPPRQEFGLPDDALVYCCLNGLQKLTRLTFERWMLILRHVPDSVLWLLSNDDSTNERIRQLAGQHGIAPERVIFTGSTGNPLHLARYPLADLFLDTIPYGAHTSASDALWMGVPVLTLSGKSFASRVCASLVRAAGLEEMVVATPYDYVRRAIELGRDRQQLAQIRQRLIAGRDSCLLFDTPRLVRHLEDLYRQMWNDFLRGERPRPDLRNLDIYHEIGVTEDLAAAESLSDEAYLSLYRMRLADRDAVAPLGPDGRLWRDCPPPPGPA